jgi:hypothetical protein
MPLVLPPCRHCGGQAPSSRGSNPRRRFRESRRCRVLPRLRGGLQRGAAFRTGPQIPPSRGESQFYASRAKATSVSETRSVLAGREGHRARRWLSPRLMVHTKPQKGLNLPPANGAKNSDSRRAELAGFLPLSPDSTGADFLPALLPKRATRPLDLSNGPIRVR